jgi:hypothetical protein
MLRPTPHARNPSSEKDCRIGAGVSSKVKLDLIEVKEKYHILGVGARKTLGMVAWGLLFEILCGT